MCEFAKVVAGQLPVCEPLNKLCTMCFMGNLNQYNEAQKVVASRQYTVKKESEA